MFFVLQASTSTHTLTHGHEDKGEDRLFPVTSLTERLSKFLSATSSFDYYCSVSPSVFSLLLIHTLGFSFALLYGEKPVLVKSTVTTTVVSLYISEQHMASAVSLRLDNSQQLLVLYTYCNVPEQPITGLPYTCRALDSLQDIRCIPRRYQSGVIYVSSKQSF